MAAIPLEYVVGVMLGVLASMMFGYFVVAPRARSLICDALGVSKVETKDGPIFTILGPDQEPVKVPIGTKEGENGPEVVLGYAPLMYTLAFVITENAAMKTKMAILGAKSGLSRAIKGQLQGEVAAGRLDPSALETMLPKKAQAALAILRALGLGISPTIGGNGPTTQEQGGGRTGYRPGIGGP